jgi:hypothetical protein
MEHGTLRSYKVLECRCEDCRAVNARYHRGFRSRYRHPSTLRHGNRSTYVNYRCRCGDCSAANRAYLSA